MKKIIDEKGRLFGKISVIDIIVIIIVVALAAGFYVKFHANDRTGTLKDLTVVEYSMSIQNVRGGIADCLRVGDNLYDQENDVCIGKITDIKVTDGTKAVQLADGTYIDGSVEGRYDIQLELEAECQINNGRYYAQRSDELNVNGEKKSYTKYAMFTGTIVEIK